MRFLFCSEHYPGILGALAAHVASLEGSETVFATGRQRMEIPLPNVQRVVLKKKRPVPEEDRYDLAWSEGIKTGQYALHTFKAIAAGGFEPDIIFVAADSGIAFFLRQAFPAAFIVDYALTAAGGIPTHIVAVRIAMQAQQMLEADLVYARSDEARRRFPEALWQKMRLVAYPVDTDFFSPDCAESWNCWKFSGQGGNLLVVSLAGADNGRAACFLRLAARLAADKQDLRIVFIVQDRAQTMPAINFVESLAEDARQRIFIAGSPEARDLRNLLVAASLVLQPGSGGAAEQFLLEAMACACPIMVRPDQAGFLRPGQNMLDLPDRPEKAIASALADHVMLEQIGANGRSSVLVSHSGASIVRPHFDEIMLAYNTKKRTRKTRPECQSSG